MPYSNRALHDLIRAKRIPIYTNGRESHTELKRFDAPIIDVILMFNVTMPAMVITYHTN